MSKPRLVVASHNQNKIREIAELTAALGIRVLSPKDLGGGPSVEENGQTFRENAEKKALALAAFAAEWVLADDSGLEVDALGGAPGVHSARFAGEPPCDRRNNAKLLRELAGLQLEQRGAQFRCVLALASPQGDLHFSEGVCRGLIGLEPRGRGGFGYDPLFLLPEYGRTFAELAPQLKNKISHRALAMQGMLKILKACL